MRGPSSSSILPWGRGSFPHPLSPVLGEDGLQCTHYRLKQQPPLEDPSTTTPLSFRDSRKAATVCCCPRQALMHIVRAACCPQQMPQTRVCVCTQRRTARWDFHHPTLPYGCTTIAEKMPHVWVINTPPLVQRWGLRSLRFHRHNHLTTNHEDVDKDMMWVGQRQHRRCCSLLDLMAVLETSVQVSLRKLLLWPEEPEDVGGELWFGTDTVGMDAHAALSAVL